jgi:hypothetical protein
MEKLIRKLRRDYPGLVFSVGEAHCWSPEYGQIFYADDGQQSGIAGLLHELGHARLHHERYDTDLDLLKKEVAAWHEARQLAGAYGLVLGEEHIEDCLDTYRDWLHKRSTCPGCEAIGIQEAKRRYTCLNCGQRWEVSTARFCRPYRQAARQTKNATA